MLRVPCLSSLAFFYALNFLFWPLRPLQTMWRVVRGRPFTWVERFLHAGFRQYVLRRTVSRVERVHAPSGPLLVQQLATRRTPRAVQRRIRSAS